MSNEPKQTGENGGCGTPVYVFGTNGGQLPCGSVLDLFGTVAPYYCTRCRASLKPSPNESEVTR